MDANSVKILLCTVASIGGVGFFIYSSHQSRAKLQQMRELPTVMQVAGFRLFQNPKLHESYRFLPTFSQSIGIDKTIYAGHKIGLNTDFTAFIFNETRGKTGHPTLVIAAKLPVILPDVCIYTKSTAFGPPTPDNQRVFSTNNAEFDKIFRITAASEKDFMRLASPQLQQYLLNNQDITHIEITQNTLALFNSDDRFFQILTTNGIPSREQFNQRLKQLEEIQYIITTNPL